MSKAWIFGVLALSGLPSCIVEGDSDPDVVIVDSGYAVIDWTIAGQKDPRLCYDFAVDVISVRLTTASGVFLGDFEQNCESFETSIELEPGRYNADATLIDAAGFAASTTLSLETFRILGNDELILAIDFPSDSFY